MNKIFGTLIFSSAVLAASTAVADIAKRSSGRDGTQCIDGGERECGIAWEGKGLFNINARASYAFTKIWEEDLDLQYAYLCCTEDQTRKNICNKKHTWVTWDHCHDYVLKFFDPANEAKIYSQSESLSDRVGDFYGAGQVKKVYSQDEPIVYPKWIDRIRELNEDILKTNPNSASARKMRSCMDQAGDFWSNEAEFVMEQVGEVFDVLTIVETGYGLGSFFIDKAVASLIRDGAKSVFADVERKYIIKGVTEFTEEDITNEMAMNFAKFADMNADMLVNTSMDEVQSTFFYDFAESYSKNFESDGIKELMDEPGAKWVKFGEEQGRIDGYDPLHGDIFSFIKPDLEEIPAVKNDPQMLLPQTRKAVNDQVLENWNSIKDIQKEAAELVNGENPKILADADWDSPFSRNKVYEEYFANGAKGTVNKEMRLQPRDRIKKFYIEKFKHLKVEEIKTVSARDYRFMRDPVESGWWGDSSNGLNLDWHEYPDRVDVEFEKKFGKPITEAILPFKDVTTDYSQEQFSKELIAERMGHLTDMRYAEGGVSDANEHAVKMGYWEDVKAERMNARDISRADKVKEAVNPQIDDQFLNIVSDMGGVEDNPANGLRALDRRLALSSRAAREKVVVGLMRTALIDGTLQGGSAIMTYMTDNPAEGCIAAIFDTLRDESKCLWNHSDGELCDE